MTQEDTGEIHEQTLTNDREKHRQYIHRAVIRKIGNTGEHS